MRSITWDSVVDLLPLQLRLRLRIRQRSRGTARADPMKLLRVHPDTLSYQQLFDGSPRTYRCSARLTVERRVSGVQLGQFDKWRFVGAVLDGDWDRAEHRIEESCFFQGLRAHFEEGVPWSGTRWVKELTELLEQGGVAWHRCRSVEEILRRCEKNERLYESLRTQGYRAKEELRPSPSLAQQLDEITVNIARDGTFLHNSGNHRLALAKLLRLEAVPVRVIVRHAEWQRRREEIATRSPAELSPATRALLGHPDLADLVPPASPAPPRAPRAAGKLPGRAVAALAALAALATLIGCAPEGRSETTFDEAPVPVVEEAFFTPSTPEDNLDSPALWTGPDAQPLLIVTAKSSDLLVVYDARTGEPIRRVGGSGTGLGRFLRPNGLAVVDDLLLVVERNGRRVQLLTLPDFQPLAIFGQERLHKPYGITAFAAAGGAIEIYVTDQHPEDASQRVKHFRLQPGGSGHTPAWVRSFGATRGEGVLHKVESILADPLHDRLLIADEVGGDLKVYTLAGEYTGQLVGSGLFHREPEGIALYACDAEGYVIATDQSARENAFHVFDRRTLAHLGTFRGSALANTDGVALTQQPLGSIRQGVLFAHHEDRSIGAIRWSEIAGALGLRSDCVEPAP